MSSFVFTTDDDSEAFCLKIASAMMVFFGISEVDAIARLNQHWQHASLTGKDDLLYHKTPDHWAKWIFFGKDYWHRADEATESSLSRLERKMNRVLDHLGLEYRLPSEHVEKLLQQNQKLQAVKLYHEETGISLIKAKEVVDRMQIQTVDTEEPSIGDTATSKAQIQHGGE